MHAVIRYCPICREELIATRLHCPSCETNIDGRFGLNPFDGLSPEQLQFAATFIRCEGKIKRVEEEMGMSYPAVRARLHDLIREMGFDVSGTEENSPVDRGQILADLAAGRITAEEATTRLSGK